VLVHLDPVLAIAAFGIGIVVGLTGMGGGALMTPVLVLFFNVPPLAAVSSDLVASAPNLNFPLYIVAPEVRMEQVRRELARPTFQALGLNERCAYFSDEDLVKNADSILRWATEATAIDPLAKRVRGASQGEGT
jgi:hypothetical protein